MRKRRYRELVADDNPITAETAALVRVLAEHDVPMAIVTGAQRDDVRAVLESSPVGEVITVVVAEEDVRRGKPDPEGFLAGAAALDRRPADMVVFEDSVPGVRGALAAGMRCIAVGAQPSQEVRTVAPAVVRAPVTRSRLVTCCPCCEVQDAGEVSTRAWVSRSSQDLTRMRLRSERK